MGVVNKITNNYTSLRIIVFFNFNEINKIVAINDKASKLHSRKKTRRSINFNRL